MRSFSLWIGILALLPIAALAHDSWYAYHNTEMGDFLQAFQLSQLGWVWTNYAADSYYWARDVIDPIIWDNIIVPALREESVVIAALPMLVVFVIGVLVKIFSFVRERIAMSGVKSGHGNKSFAFDDNRAKKTQIQYKRK